MRTRLVGQRWNGDGRREGLAPGDGSGRLVRAIGVLIAGAALALLPACSQSDTVDPLSAQAGGSIAAEETSLPDVSAEDAITSSSQKVTAPTDSSTTSSVSLPPSIPGTSPGFDAATAAKASSTTVAPTSAPPTTAAPTTPAPTAAPTTPAPTAAPTTAAPTTATPTSGGGSGNNAELAAAEAESLRLLNELRSSLGLQTLTASDPEMSAFARSWALDMRNNGFRHSSAQWSENIVWFSRASMTPAEAAAKHHDMWINSPGHYRNMTKPEWTIVGVGMWHDETGWWGVHVFR